ncbi:MAG: hypothetical protein ABIG89_06035 [Candidatus Woesearchaeota archaeon]
MPVDLVTPAMFVGFKDTIILIIQSPVAMAVEIVNQQIADSIKQYFDFFWEQTEKLK